MRKFNLANAAKRDAEIGFEPAAKPERVSYRLPDGARPRTVRYVKTTATINALTEQFGDLEQVGQAIVDGDPEIDVEVAGRFLDRPLKVYVSPDGQVVYRVRLEEVVYDPAGAEKERRELTRAASNVAGETPITWSKRAIPKADAIRRFVFSRSYQLRHTNGLTFDFLFQMAQELAKDNTLRLVGSGPQGTGPLILTTGGEPYRGFLEGRVDGDRYCLLLHLSNLELRALPKEETE
ncbi:MAG: hypothetical protein QM804_06820 [Propionicimonas sp.]